MRCRYSNPRDLVASSPSFSRPAARPPPPSPTRELTRQRCQKVYPTTPPTEFSNGNPPPPSGNTGHRKRVKCHGQELFCKHRAWQRLSYWCTETSSTYKGFVFNRLSHDCHLVGWSRSLRPAYCRSLSGDGADLLSVTIIYLFIYNNFIVKIIRLKGVTREELNLHNRAIPKILYIYIYICSKLRSIQNHQTKHSC